MPLPTPLPIPGFDDAVPVGLGGYGVVFRARQQGIDRDVAVKVLSVRPTRSSVEQFERECRAIGALSGHPNVVAVHDVGATADGRPFIVMEYLHGGSLADRLRLQGPVPWAEAVEIGVKLSGALQAAHEAGVLHGDVKPENVLVSHFGEPKLGDFGIAVLEGVASGPRTAASPLHAAPEVLAGGPPTIGSDVYSLGSTVLTLIAGRPPSTPKGAGGASGVPDALRHVLDRAVASDPQLRQPGAGAIGVELRAALAGIKPEVTLRGRAEPRRRRPSVGWSIVAVGVLVLAVAVTLRINRPPSPTAAQPPATSAESGPPPAPVSTVARPLAAPNELLFTDDFSTPQGWPEVNDERRSASYADGGYLVGVSGPGNSFTINIPSPVRAVSGIRISLEATSQSDAAGRFAVLCDNRLGGPLPYLVDIETSGAWSLQRTSGAGLLSETLASSGRPPSRSPPVRSTGVNRLDVECAQVGDRTRVTVDVNGERLAEVFDATRQPGPVIPALIVLADRQGGKAAAFLFDNVVVTAL